MYPEILTHPNIPKPLHGLNPRTIKGKEWWDIERSVAYARDNYHCTACFTPASKAKYFQYLEAHELYKYDLYNYTLTFVEAVALCHSCHNFIHSGRMWALYEKDQITKAKITDILKHGFIVLKRHNLKPFIGTQVINLKLKGKSNEEIIKKLKLKDSDLVDDIDTWNKWRLIIDEVEYEGNFKNFNEWETYYSNHYQLKEMELIVNIK